MADVSRINPIRQLIRYLLIRKMMSLRVLELEQSDSEGEAENRAEVLLHITTASLLIGAVAENLLLLQGVNYLTGTRGNLF